MTHRLPWLAAALAVWACGEKLDPIIADVCFNHPNISGVTYTTQVKPILDRSCVPCHSTNSTDRNSAPRSHNYEAYEIGNDDGAKFWSEVIAQVAANGTMPPEASTEPPVSEEERCILKTWHDEGAVE